MIELPIWVFVLMIIGCVGFLVLLIWIVGSFIYILRSGEEMFND